NSDPNRLRGQAPRSVLKCEWDLYSLGKTILKFIEAFEKNHAKEWSPYCRRYIRLLSCRLLDGLNTDAELALGLPRTTLQEIKYRSIEQAKTDLDKLIGSYNLEVRIPELNLFTQDTIQASTLSTTPFTARVKTIASHPAFMRLGLCTQLGLLNLVYPTARHTRYEHSLGTFSVLCRFLLSLYNDTLNPLFRQIMDEEDLKAALLVALLHDIGQYPLAHDLEEADHQFFSHEDLGLAILQKNSDLKRAVEGAEDWNVPMERVISILRADPATMKGSLKDRILHSLIDGPIDADKLDYLMRDSRNLGLTYGLVLDFERLLRCLTVIYREQEEQTYAVLGIHEKGKVTAESVGFARYALFGQVYWHHAYRGVKAMIHRIVWETVNSPGLDRAKMRADFREFLMPDETVLPFEEQMTFTITPKKESRLSVYHSQADENDLSVLDWFSERSTPAGKELFELIAKRQLFKRIFVLSKEGGTDKALWENVTEFFGANRKNWRAKLALQNNFQRKLTDFVDQPPAGQTLSQPLDPTLRNKFLAEARDKIIVLIDIPPERKASNISLEYLVEEDRQRFKREEVKTENLEQSIIWRAIQNSFQESLGKLRLFCHPDYADFLARSIPRKTFESILSTSLKETERALAKS
ncbi:MAG: HD domain-containing protein, partial [Verrucomicrobiota bacterium]